jgi:fatty acid desaturase
MNLALDDRELRARLKAMLPEAALRHTPARAFLALPLLALIAAGSWAIVAVDHVLLKLILALAVGSTYASLVHLGHEVAHGAVFRSRRLQDLLLWPCFAIYCVSPYLWRHWHNAGHHSHTNEPDRDPDSPGTTEAFQETTALGRGFVLCSPGSGRILGWVLLGCAFTLHAQDVLWRRSQMMPGLKQLSRVRAALGTVLLAVSWCTLGVALGFLNALFVIIIPMYVANAAVMLYIITNHWISPLATGSDILRTTLSLRSLRVLDLIYLNFSHHVEHHLFPSMSSRYYPMVRKALRAEEPQRFQIMSHWKVLRILFRSPRLYADAHTLSDTRGNYDLRRLRSTGAAAERPEAGAPDASASRAS